MSRGRGSSLAAVVAALALLAVWSACWSFVGGSSRVASREAETKTAMNAWERKRPHDMMYRKSTAKDRQAARSVEMANKGKDDDDDEEEVKEKVNEIEWPLPPNDDVKLYIHVEYDEEFGVFPQPGNLEVEKFYREMNRRFGGKVRMIHNEPTALKKTVPVPADEDEDDWRKPRRGSFEVIDCSTEAGEVLYSKLKTGESLVWAQHSKSYIDSWMEKIAAKYNLDAKEEVAEEAAEEEVPAEEPVDA
eukprot:TRINITY_DN112272_c0_g1_i1.p1 TRINITY_DN112272_c0_g1~~TRINITY_DN112272_c0_g1_i1.p1  ORF type:complete len:247 (+),score=98.93 TRINITY_DN112272_c0_g1_i1:66-806(+)